MIVTYRGGRKFELEHRGHRVLTDQLPEHGGEDAGLTPTELLVGALASCTALYAAAVAARHGLSREQVSVEADWQLAPEGDRVQAIQLRLRFARAVPPLVAEAIRRAAEQCLVHRTLQTPPQISTEVVLPPG